MTSNYYIYQDEKKLGPYDLVSLIKKIRNGTLAPHTLVASDSSEPQAAEFLPELNEFFAIPSGHQEHHHPSGRIQQMTLSHVLKTGLHFLQGNQSSAIHTGMFIFCCILFVVLTWKLGVIGHIIAAILSFAAFGIYMLCILRLTRGQTIEVGFIHRRVMALLLPFLISSAIVSLLAMIGLVLIAIPGLFILTFYIFTPLLVLDKGMDFWDAMETSRRTVLSSGTDLIGIIFSLVVITFVSTLFILPLLIALPITVSAISEIYDEFFYH